MKKMITMLFSLYVFIGVNTVAAEDTLKVGDLAPDFTLVDQKNQLKTLSKMQGQWVVLYFYPKDETPGCVAEACSFRDNIIALQAKKTVVWGISVDNQESHADFSKNHKLPFTLLADSEGKVAQRYGSLNTLFFFKIAKRHSFIIDSEGKIAKIYREVTPKTHVEEILTDLKALQASN